MVTVAKQAAPTVIVTQRVKPGREEAFWHWQECINRAVAKYSGFLGTEVVAPANGGGEWTVVYRFDSLPHLEAWLESGERERLLASGMDLLAVPASQQVIMDGRDEGLVTAVLVQLVDPALEDEFVRWQQQLTDAESRFPGFHGSQLFRPVPGVQEKWVAMFRFDTEEHLNDWLQSPERMRLLEEGARFSDVEIHRVASSFGSWFSFGGQRREAASPNWKTALSVLVGLYPTVVVLTVAISEVWPGGVLWQTLLVGNVLSVTLLTWAVMPGITRALNFWLVPESGRAGRRLDLIGAALSIGLVAVAATAAWLITTVAWTLP